MAAGVRLRLALYNTSDTPQRPRCYFIKKIEIKNIAAIID
jgi:hypothetical protein